MMKSTSSAIIFSMAFRNIVRNTRRSLLSASTIAIIAVSVCLLFALTYGLLNDIETNIINQVSGNIRVRNQVFSDNERVQPLQFFIPQTDELLSTIESQNGIVDAEPQINVGATIYRNEDFTAIRTIGINFQTSRFFTDQYTHITSGTIPTSTIKNGVIITQRMANNFDLKVGDKFTVWWGQTAISGNNAATVTVSGIATIGNNDFSGLNVFMDWKFLSKSLRMNGNSMEILVYTEKNLSASKTENLISTIQSFAKPDSPLEVKKWNEVNMMVQMFGAMKIMYFFMAFFFFLMAATIIFNSTMMAVLERKKEIGALMALGMAAKRIKNLFLLESTLVAFFASLTGVFIGFVLISILGSIGISSASLGADAISDMSLSSRFYPSLGVGGYLLVLCMGTFTATLACILPARMALKVQPAEALRSEE